MTDFDIDSTLTWDGIHDAVETLGLQRNVAELERNGITTITPEQSGITPEVLAAIRESLLDLGEQMSGAHFDLEKGPGQSFRDAHEMRMSEVGSQSCLTMIAQLVGHGRSEFIDFLLNPAMNTLVGYLLGPGRCLSSLSGFLKWKAGQEPEGKRFEPTDLHTDSPVREGAVPIAPPLVANTNLLLTDYGCWDDGPLVIAPGSHREGRQPLPFDASRMVGAIAPAGSIFVFGGGLQHGSVQRRNEGMRVSINAYYCQPYVLPQEYLQRQFPDVEARGALAKQLLWGKSAQGWGVNGPTFLPAPYRPGTAPANGYGIVDKAKHSLHKGA